ncbi:unnamed protein product [Adineta ricciae]|uniref:Uncharacterized protein n=1 Tax=Adineta ricciae TaxID=249248 RepID=A0A815D750_ADIRI|nr:unnamed protein product [Adineta ricciae]
MFHKYNSISNSLTPSDQVSAYAPQGFGTKEATNNFFVAPQPKGRQPGGSGPLSAGALAAREMSISRFFLSKIGLGGSSATSAVETIADKAQTVVEKAQTVAAAATKAVASNVSSHGASHAHVASSSSSSHAAQSHGHGHDSHAAPWEGVNLWRTPYKGDTDTITQVKRSKGSLDKYVENRTRRIQQLQLFALRNKSTPTWVMMPRDKALFAVQGLIVGYVLYQVVTSVYQHLKAKDRIKLLKLLYKDNVD